MSMQDGLSLRAVSGVELRQRFEDGLISDAHLGLYLREIEHGLRERAVHVEKQRGRTHVLMVAKEARRSKGGGLLDTLV
jgi:hypothetical protein